MRLLDRSDARQPVHGSTAAKPTYLRTWELLHLSHMAGLSGTGRLDERGRLVLPAELRRRLGFHPGDEVRITEEDDGTLRIESRRAAARALIGLAGVRGQSVLKELRADRLQQAAAEDRDANPSARR